MTEIELNTIFNIVCDPEKNVYKLDSVKKIQEVQRIARVFADQTSGDRIRLFHYVDELDSGTLLWGID